MAVACGKFMWAVLRQDGMWREVPHHKRSCRDMVAKTQHPEGQDVMEVPEEKESESDVTFLHSGESLGQRAPKAAVAWSLTVASYIYLIYAQLLLSMPSRFQFRWVPQSCPILCNPVDCSKPGLPVHHQHPEFTQTPVHWVNDAIQLSHPLLSPSPATFNLSQHQGLYKWVNSSHQVAKVLEFQLQHQSFQWIFNKLVIPKPCSAEEVLSEKIAMGNAAWVPTLGFPAHISKLQSGKPDLKRQFHLAHPFWNKIPFR